MYRENEDKSQHFAPEEAESDGPLAADDLQLPEDASMLVRLHALRAWLDRRRAEVDLDIGSATLELQELTREVEQQVRPRRRTISDDFLLQRSLRYLTTAQQRLSAYDEASTLLDDCLAHTTAGERLLVEYYLSLEELVQASESPADSPWLAAMADVMQRVEQVSIASEEDA